MGDKTTRVVPARKVLAHCIHTLHVDEDGDGLCDTHGIAPGEGTAQGYNRWFRAEGETEQTPMIRRGGYSRRAAAQ